MKKFVSMYQPTNSKSFYSAINQNKNLNLFKITDKYLEDEHRAKAGNKGIWATTFLTPSDYRKKTGKE